MRSLLEGPRRIGVAVLWLPLSLAKVFCIMAALAGLLWGVDFARTGDWGTAGLMGATFLAGSWAWWALRTIHAVIRRPVR